MYTPVYMAKLYWRIKKNNRWTWVAAQVTEIERCVDPDTRTPAMYCIVYLEEEQ